MSPERGRAVGQRGLAGLGAAVLFLPIGLLIAGCGETPIRAEVERYNCVTLTEVLDDQKAALGAQKAELEKLSKGDESAADVARALKLSSLPRMESALKTLEGFHPQTEELREANGMLKDIVRGWLEAMDALVAACEQRDAVALKSAQIKMQDLAQREADVTHDVALLAALLGTRSPTRR